MMSSDKSDPSIVPDRPAEVLDEAWRSTVQTQEKRPHNPAKSLSDGLTKTQSTPRSETRAETDGLTKTQSTPRSETRAETDGITKKKSTPRSDTRAGTVSSKSIAEFQTAGARALEILSKRGQYSIKTPAMLPPVPVQDHVDAFPAEKMTGKPKSIQEQQRSYEAECLVFRALEKIAVEEDIVVLHNFKYWKKHLTEIFVTEDKDKEHEHDFIVLIKSKAIVALEVKAPVCEGPHDSDSKRFKTQLSSARKQLDNIEELVKAIAVGCGEEMPTIFKIRVFPSVTRRTAAQLESYMKLGQGEKADILLKDDLDGDMSDGLAGWWKSNISDKLPHPQTKEGIVAETTQDTSANCTKVESTLLGLWCVNKAGGFETDKCTLVHWINNVDDQLKPSVVTSSTNNLPYSKNVIKASKKNNLELFSEYLGIKFLLKEQQKVYNKSRVFLNAPAGAGKTLLIQAKILHLIKNSATSAEKIVVVMFGENASEEYRDVLRHAGVSVELLKYSKEINPALDLVTVVQETDFSVVLVYARVLADDEIQWAMHTLASLRNTNSHIFLDDVQQLLWSVVYDDVRDKTDYSSTIVNTISELLSGSAATTERVVWVVSDFMQCFYYYSNTVKQVAKLMNILSQLPHLFLETLSANLRNSTDIAALLSHIRCSSITRFNAALPSDTPADIMDRFLPKQIEGHRIHGSIPSLYILNKDRVTSSIPNICKSALQELFTPPCSLNPSDLAIITMSYSDEELTTLLEAGLLGDIPYTTAATRAAGSSTAATRANNNSVWTGDVNDTLSLEWPAAIVVFDLTDTDWYMYEDMYEDEHAILSALYLAVSRARVHCHILVVYRDARSRGGARHLRDVWKQHVIVRQDDLLGEDDDL